MDRDDQAYFAERAAEEAAAAERATCPAAASAHRELSLRYSLNVARPGSARTSDDAPIGLPKPRYDQSAADPRRPARKRRRA